MQRWNMSLAYSLFARFQMDYHSQDSESLAEGWQVQRRDLSVSYGQVNFL